jgi:hypothetical protein
VVNGEWLHSPFTIRHSQQQRHDLGLALLLCFIEQAQRRQRIAAILEIVERRQRNPQIERGRRGSRDGAWGPAQTCGCGSKASTCSLPANGAARTRTGSDHG